MGAFFSPLLLYEEFVVSDNLENLDNVLNHSEATNFFKLYRETTTQDTDLVLWWHGLVESLACNFNATPSSTATVLS